MCYMLVLSHLHTPDPHYMLHYITTLPMTAARKPARAARAVGTQPPAPMRRARQGPARDSGRPRRARWTAGDPASRSRQTQQQKQPRAALEGTPRTPRCPLRAIGGWACRGRRPAGPCRCTEAGVCNPGLACSTLLDEGAAMAMASLAADIAHVSCPAHARGESGRRPAGPCVYGAPCLNDHISCGMCALACTVHVVEVQVRAALPAQWRLVVMASLLACFIRELECMYWRLIQGKAVRPHQNKSYGLLHTAQASKCPILASI